MTEQPDISFAGALGGDPVDNGVVVTANQSPDTATQYRDTTVALPATLTPRQMAWRRFWRHKGAAASAVIMFILLLLVAVPQWTGRYGINDQVLKISEGANQNLSPRDIAWFGTDGIGRDIYTRLLFGVRTSLMIGIASALLSVLVGTTVGAFAGLRGGRFDDLMMRVTDIFLAFPFLVAVIVVREFMGGLAFLKPIIGDKTSIRFMIVLFAFFGWMVVARLVRGQVLALKEREFVEAARAAGSTNRRLVASHLLPNAIGPILVAGTLSVTAAIVGESTLSFFGFGPQPGSASTSLGKLVELSRSGAQQGNWWLVVFPCGALVLLALCINFIGDGLRDALDPKLDMGR